MLSNQQHIISLIFIFRNSFASNEISTAVHAGFNKPVILLWLRGGIEHFFEGLNWFVMYSAYLTRMRDDYSRPNAVVVLICIIAVIAAIAVVLIITGALSHS